LIWVVSGLLLILFVWRQCGPASISREHAIQIVLDQRGARNGVDISASYDGRGDGAWVVRVRSRDGCTDDYRVDDDSGDIDGGVSGCP